MDNPFPAKEQPALARCRLTPAAGKDENEASRSRPERSPQRCSVSSAALVSLSRTELVRCRVERQPTAREPRPPEVV